MPTTVGELAKAPGSLPKAGGSPGSLPKEPATGFGDLDEMERAFVAGGGVGTKGKKTEGKKPKGAPAAKGAAKKKTKLASAGAGGPDGITPADAAAPPSSMKVMKVKKVTFKKTPQAKPTLPPRS